MNVDANGQNVPNDAANEPSIAVDPTDSQRMVIGWRQFDSVTSDFRQAGYGYTTDAGATWRSGTLTPGIFRSDPVIGVAADGTFYYGSLKIDLSNDVFVSTNGGASWGPALPAWGGDKQWMIADRTGTAGDGNIYAYWSAGTGCCGLDVFTRSTTLATSFDTPIALPMEARWGTLDVSRDGLLYVVGVGNAGSPLWIFRSSDARDPLTPVVTFDLSRSVDLGGDIVIGVGVNPIGLLGQPWIAVDRSNGPTSGWLYVLASVDPTGPDPADVRFARSSDGGLTWSASRRVNDDAGSTAYQWFGTMSVAPSGRIDVVWNDTRNDPLSLESELYYAYSTDGGSTFSTSVPVSPPWEHGIGYPQNDKIGDYYHMVSDDTGASLAYAATYNGEQDVYYMRIPWLGNCPLIVLSPPTLPDAVVGQPYAVVLSASGGTAPYLFTVSSGLPPGLALSSGGILSGIPTLAGSYAFDVTATDAIGCSGMRSYDLVVGQCPFLTVDPPALPGGFAGAPYSQILSASGGLPPYTFALTAGSLPQGLTLTPGGLLSGTPTTSGSAIFQVTATDANGCKGYVDYALAIGVVPDIVTGMGLGPPNWSEVRLFDRSGTPTGVAFDAFVSTGWGVNVASADVEGHAPSGGLAAVLAGPGPGPQFGPQVRGFVRDGTPLPRLNYFAYGTLRHGVNVEGGALDAVPEDRILTGPGPGEVFGPHVRGWRYAATSGVSPSPGCSFFAYSTLRWGVNVASASVEGDPREEILTGPGPGIVFGPNVRGFRYDGTSVAGIGRINFFAFPTPQYGANVAGGDVEADGFDDMLVATGPGPLLPDAFAGFEDDGAGVRALPGFGVAPYGTLYGGRVGAGVLAPDDHAELLTGPGRDPAAASEVRAYAYDGTALSPTIAPFTAYTGATFGVNVAAGALGL